VDGRSNEYDVSLRIKTTDPQAVNEEIDRIYADLYQGAPTDQLDEAFGDVAKLYQGKYPGYHACDTAYHDTQHVLDVTLAMARLINGYERGRIGVQPIDASLFRLGVITALFHDCGYVRELSDNEHKNGAEMTLVHVTRGAHFLQHYLPKIGMANMADLASQLIHFTGYEMAVADIKVEKPVHRLLGTMLGSADIIAQMADRCYLEKCRDRLYPEFVAGGLTTTQKPDGEKEIVYASGLDLVMKTPRFFEVAKKRLNVDLDASHNFAHKHFGGQNIYLDEVEKNIRFAEMICKEGEQAAPLNRTPPKLLKE
jgi:hypothetical protein